MLLIRKTGLKSITSKSGKVRRRQYGIFECPRCLQEVEKTIQNGEKALSCGGLNCKDTHPEEGSQSKRDPLYSAWANMKAFCKDRSFSYPKEWDDFNTFFNEIGRLRKPGSQLTRIHKEQDYSVDNCYWMLPNIVKDLKPNTEGQRSVTTGRLFEQHGMCATRPYKIWQNMINRCYNPKHKSYKNYGEKGIGMCDEWRNSFVAFWEDMEEGYEEPLTIGRKEHTQGYFKSNCGWETLEENSGKSRAIITQQLDKITGELVKEWDSARQASIALDVDASSITKVLKGKKKSAGGFFWQYA